MRILILSQFLPPVIGGEEFQTYYLGRELAARGHEVTFVTQKVDGLPDFESGDNWTFYRVGGLFQQVTWLFKDQQRRHAPPFPDPETSLALRRILREKRPEIIYAVTWMANSLIPTVSSDKKRRPKIVLGLQDYSLLCAQKRRMYRGQLCRGPGPEKCLRCSAKHYGLLKGTVTATSNYLMLLTKRKVVDLFLPVSQAVAQGSGLVDSRLPFEVIPNFVPDNIASPLPVESRYTEQLPHGDFILFVGDLSYDKGVGILVEAYRRLESAPPLVFIGRRTPSIQLSGDSRVRVLEIWPHHAVMEAWRRCTFGVVPSVWAEPFATVVLEGMSCGRALVGSNIGGISDQIVDNETGLLVTPGSIEALHLALERLLGDTELRARMGASGKQRASQFFASAVVPRFEKAFENLLSR